MKKTWKKTMKTTICGLLLCLTALLCMPGVRTEAAKKPTCVKKQTVYIGPFESPYDTLGYSGWLFIKNLSANAKIVNVKSSNENIICFANKDRIHICAGENEIGQKTKLTFKVKQNKKTYKLSCKITVKKAKCAFKSLKINGKEYAKKTTATNGVELKLPYKKVKISAKMSSGHKLKSIELNRQASMAFVKVKNGSKITLKQGDTIRITYIYKKPKYVPKTKEWKNFQITNYVDIYVK